MFDLIVLGLILLWFIPSLLRSAQRAGRSNRSLTEQLREENEHARNNPWGTPWV